MFIQTFGLGCGLAEKGIRFMLQKDSSSWAIYITRTHAHLNTFVLARTTMRKFLILTNFIINVFRSFVAVAGFGLGVVVGAGLDLAVCGFQM